MIKIILPLLLISTAIATHAQEKQTELEEIILTDKFLKLTPETATENAIVITKSDLKNSPAKSIDEVLQQYAGLDVRRRGANGVQSDISIRGGTYEQVLILLNGVKMNDAQTGHNSLNIPVAVANIERIEIIKGPAARRFGQNAYSGVINIVTRTSSEEIINASAEIADFNSYSFGAGGTFGTEKFTNLIQLNTSRSDGYRYNTDYEIKSAYYQNQYLLRRGKIKFQGGFSEKKFGANGFYSTPTATEQYEELQASVVSLGIEQEYEKLKWNAAFSWRRGQDLYLFNRAKPEVYRNMHLGNNLGAELNGSYRSRLGISGIGVEFRKEFLVSNNLGNRERDNTTIFIEHHFSFLNDRLKISPGISWASFSGGQSFYYPGLDVGYAVNASHQFYGNIGKVHRVPTFTDLYYISGTEKGNPELEPESALSYEIGYRYMKNNWLAKASIFGRDSQNAIDFIKYAPAEKWAATNLGNVNTKGLELELKKNWNSFIKSFSVGYVFLENRADQEVPFSRYVSDNFRHQLISKIENKIGKLISNQLIYRYQQRSNGQSYHLLDEKLSFDYKNLDLYILINNITNTKYTENFGVPMPQRWFHIGVSFEVPFQQRGK